LTSVASWLGTDSYLGGGDLVSPGQAVGQAAEDEERYHAWRGVAAVVELAAQLAEGATTLFAAELPYAGLVSWKAEAP
jgi:hypothetical protein